MLPQGSGHCLKPPLYLCLVCLLLTLTVCWQLALAAAAASDLPGGAFLDPGGVCQPLRTLFSLCSPASVIDLQFRHRAKYSHSYKDKTAVFLGYFISSYPSTGCALSGTGGGFSETIFFTHIEACYNWPH